MRKMVFGRQLSRGKKGREALLRSLIKAVIFYGKITTTKAKAKAISAEVDKLVTVAKKNSLSGRRKVLAYLANDRDAVDHLFGKVLPAFSQRKSGFTRIILLPARRGDKAEMVRLEWVEQITEKESKRKTVIQSKTETKKKTKTSTKKKS